MNTNQDARLRQVGAFILWAGVFALSYAQSPLYTSNQNQYFLKGLANAGYGFLADDWLAAKTLDPTPVFSWLVEWSYRLLHWEPLFYIYYAVLMGIYFYSILGIADWLYGFNHNRTQKLAFMTIVVGLHSAVLRLVLSRALGPDWTYLFEGGVAGQRVLGTVLQPSSFGVLLILSIYLFLHGRVYWAAALLPLAATVHPTYLLSAATLTVAFALITWRLDKSLKRPILMGLLSLALVAPILNYSLQVFLPQNMDLYQRTREAMVAFRIPHHALLEEWLGPAAYTTFGLILSGMWLARRTRLAAVMVIPTAVILSLTVAQILTQDPGLALLFPWRMTILLLPLGVCVVSGWAFEQIWARNQAWFANHTTGVTRLAYSVLALLVIAGVARFMIDTNAKHTQPEAEVIAFAAANATAGQNYIVPINMQDFRLATGIPIVIDFKAIAYQERDFNRWLVRVRNANWIYETDKSEPERCIRLLEVSRQMSATHMVVPVDTFKKVCPGSQLIYEDANFEVWALGYMQRQ